jgi:hypothetical protein
LVPRGSRLRFYSADSPNSCSCGLSHRDEAWFEVDTTVLEELLDQLEHVRAACDPRVRVGELDDDRLEIVAVGEMVERRMRRYKSFELAIFP